MKKNSSNDLLKSSNVVGVARISEQLDLTKIYSALENTSFEPEQFSGLIYRVENPKGTVTLFKTGNILCTGAKDPQTVKKIISNLVNELEFLEIPVYDNYKVQIRNMVFTKSLNKPINLAKVALSFGLENVDYEPADFPGLIYKIEEPKVTFILFESGKIICTGVDSNAQAEEAFIKLERKFKRYKIFK